MRARVRIRADQDARAAEREVQRRGFRLAEPHEPIDLLVVDEWTAEGDSHVQAARRAGVPVTVLAELVLELAQGPVVGVTGTAGKTSACRSLEAILFAAGRRVSISRTARSSNAWPDHSLADGCAPGVVTVAELTSTHLCHMRHVHPDVAVVTTIRPDHVELHGSLAAYVAAKRRLVGELTPADVLVLPCDDAPTVDAIGACPARPVGFGAAPVDGRDGAFAVDDRVALRWDGRELVVPSPAYGTGLRALLAASAAALALGVAPEAVGAALPGVPGVRHRMSRAAGPRGITVIDDTMAATPLKGMAAVDQMAPGDLVVVLGGNDAPDGLPVHSSPEESSLLASALAHARRRARVLVAFGPAARRVGDAVRIDIEAPTLEAALEAAVDACGDGGTVLVSPMFPLAPSERDVVSSRY